MVVSDSGLSSIVPQWWNSSPLGCVLIGSQPRGGWQVFQRAAQWGNDAWAHSFGVNCSKPILYEYFACSMRNRIEVWNSPRWTSPTDGAKKNNLWQTVGDARVARPTKLIDGSRGGQAFLCSLLRPRPNQRYSIGEQARAQLQSIILIVAGFLNLDRPDCIESLKEALREDFEFSDRLGVVFGRLFLAILIINFLVIVLMMTVFYSLWVDSIYGKATAYIIKICSISAWVVGATGLLMMGGNPRIKIVSTDIPSFVEDRIQALACKGGESESDASSGPNEASLQPMDRVEIEFGSVHGSVYTPDYGTCTLPFEVVRTVCGMDIEFSRTWRWFIGMLWFGSMMLCSIALQIAGIKCAKLGAEILGVIVLFVTSVLRGNGISGREEWLIPKWKCRAKYGATLQGVLESRNYSV